MAEQVKRTVPLCERGKCSSSETGIYEEIIGCDNKRLNYPNRGPACMPASNPPTETEGRDFFARLMKSIDLKKYLVQVLEDMNGPMAGAFVSVSMGHGLCKGIVNENN